MDQKSLTAFINIAKILQNLSSFTGQAQIIPKRQHSSKGHDTSGHCQKLIHVPGHMRKGKHVKPYNRICGQDHDEKEAQQKNREETRQNKRAEKNARENEKLLNRAFRDLNSLPTPYHSHEQTIPQVSVTVDANQYPSLPPIKPNFLTDNNTDAQGFFITQSVSPSFASPTDVISTKEALYDLGYYLPESEGITPYPDQQLFDGISAFQRDNGLDRTGILRPDDLTVDKMNELLGYGSTTRFDRLLSSVYQEEGGYEDDPAKIDQPTNMGVIQGSLNRFKAAHPTLGRTYPATVKDLTRDQATTIYKMDYYDAYRIEEIKNEKLAKTLFDLLANHSPIEPIQWVQQGINQLTSFQVDEDGIMGSQTINALNNLTLQQMKEVNNYIVRQRSGQINQYADANPAGYGTRRKGLTTRSERHFIK